ncbi:hypothetical protein CDD83_4836 [Cordyceps sp. RAO-2017]|nr:hypothetical protein CDD83_4836 [Cordyceps sp. RAO-2017]
MQIFRSALMALLAVGAMADTEESTTAPDEMANDVQMQESLVALQQKVRFDWTHLPHHLTTVSEPACAKLWDHCPWGVTFTRRRRLIFSSQESGGTNTTLFFQRQMLRRARNTASQSAELTREEATVRINSTTEGWAVGAYLTTGGAGALSQADLVISAEYGREKTSEWQWSVSESSSFKCPPYHECRSEAWAMYARISGLCHDEHDLECGRYRRSVCASPAWMLCSQLEQWCGKAERRFQRCEMVTPVMDGGRPHVTEVFFEEPIRSLHKKPRITGYHAGSYQLGSKKLLYSPGRAENRYWTKAPGVAHQQLVAQPR